MHVYVNLFMRAAGSRCLCAVCVCVCVCVCVQVRAYACAIVKVHKEQFRVHARPGKAICTIVCALAYMFSNFEGA